MRTVQSYLASISHLPTIAVSGRGVTGLSLGEEGRRLGTYRQHIPNPISSPITIFILLNKE